jgi:four helix bundle protein
MKNVKSHKNLQIWSKGMDITESVYRLVRDFPKEEQNTLVKQLKRCAVSIPSNIAEGFGRNSDKSFEYFLAISRGSLYELETQLLLADRFKFINDASILQSLLFQIEEEGKMINAFVSYLKKKNRV